MLLFFRWARIREAAAVSALFILAELDRRPGWLFHRHPVAPVARVWSWPAPAIVGGTAGSHFGSQRFPVRTISLVFAIVLVIAGTKLIFTGNNCRRGCASRATMDFPR